MDTQNYDELDKLTDQHWQRTQLQTETYISTLLPREMEHAYRQHPFLAQQAPCDTLTLLVGFSPDPLLQTIWVYRPHRIVLLLNDKYTGKQVNRMREDFLDWIEQLVASPAFIQTQPSGRTVSAIPDCEKDTRIAPKAATAEWVFQTLTELVLPDQREGKSIVVDITGAKKKMTAGAYLFAAYAGAQISYVDFEKYADQSRRPFGYSCEIGPIPNPYDRLGLRDWQNVRKLYDQFAFGKAASEVNQLRQRMEEYGYLATAEKKSAMLKLEKALIALEKWDNGDFTAALQGWQEQRLPSQLMPQAMKELGARPWPSAAKRDLYQQHMDLKQGKPSPQESIFNHPEWLLIYAYDELDKINRLNRFNNDYRSALLRAAGLDELLLKARAAVLWLIGKVTPCDSSSNFHTLVKASNAYYLRRFLVQQDSLILKNGTFRHASSAEKSITMEPYWKEIPNLQLDPEKMANLRNEAIHTHLSIPPSMATDAYHIASYSINDFKANWVKQLKKPIPTYHAWQLDWNDLCTACGINFLPRLPLPSATSKETAK